MKIRIKPSSVLLFVWFVFLPAQALADKIFLKSGTEFEGVITKESEVSVELDMGGGTMTISKDKIRSISRSTPEEKETLRQAIDTRQARLKAKEEEFSAERERRFSDYGEWAKETAAGKPHNISVPNEVRLLKVEYSKDILVEAVINGKVKATLILDTGSPFIVLTRRMGDALGVDFSDMKRNVSEIHLAGRRRLVKVVRLESVRLQDVEEKDIMADVLIENEDVLNLKDGLLGMAFLNRFVCVIDLENMKMRLQKKQGK
jgi:clan AA aspartic protease (TIGR02281 family)